MSALPLVARADDSRATVAVYPERSGQYQQYESQLADMLTQRLVNSARYAVVDRAHMQAILGEQAYSAQGQVTPATEAQIGRMLGVSYLIIPRVEKLTATNEQRNDVLSILSKSSSFVTKIEILDRIEIIEVRSGQIVQSVEDSQTTTSQPFSASAPNSGQAFTETEVPKLIDSSADALTGKIDATKLVDSKPAAQVSGHVLQVDGDTIIVSLGSDALSVGQMLGLYNVRVVHNPDTGKNIEALIKRGTIQIVSTAKDYSIAKPVTGKPIKNQTVRPE
ncbi:MAG TPA: CsgG/HfaB family protein [Candidatus Limnocylindria bacterium]|jgi:curli biogenesis system outer membrane secretion channel CsgG|nr:CsgG/HfaB family protein [Candidatus Limnocylindria bacterium]